LGSVSSDPKIKIENKKNLILEAPMNNLIDAWKGGLK